MIRVNPYRPPIIIFFLIPLVIFNCFDGAVSVGQGNTLVTLEQDSVKFSDNITVRFTNIADQKIAVFTSGCSLPEDGYLPTLVVEKREKGEWNRAGAPVCIAIASPPIYLAPGEAKAVTFPVHLGLEASQANGLFRYVFDIRTEKEDTYPAELKVPKEMRTSPPFKIVAKK